MSIGEYKQYLEEKYHRRKTISKDIKKVEKPIKKIKNFLDWYLHKNISDILSNQMFHEHHYVLERLEFSPDLQKIAYATYDHSIRVDRLNECKIESNELIFKYHTQKLICILFSNDGSKLATLGDDKLLILWDINEQTFLLKLKPENENFTCLAFSSNDRLFAAGTEDSLVILWELREDYKGHKLKYLFQEHKKAVSCVVFSKDDALILSGGHDKLIIMHNAKTGEIINIFKDHFDTVTSLRFSPVDHTFISGGKDKKIILWDYENKTKIKEFKNRVSEIIHVRYTPQGDRIISTDKDCKVYVFDLDGTVLIGPLKEHNKHIESLGFVKDEHGNDILVTGSRDKMIVKSDISTGKVIKKPLSDYPTKSYNSLVVLAPDSIKLITITYSTSLSLYSSLNSADVSSSIITKWKSNIGFPEERVEYPNIYFTLLVFSSNSDGFAAATKDRKIYLWKISNIKAPFSIIEKAHHDEITALAYYSDKNAEILAAGSKDRLINLWDALKQKKITDTLEGHQAAIGIIEFSPEGHRMATYSYDMLNTIVIWDALTGTRLFGLNDHLKAQITSIKFSIDSKKMACGTKFGSVYIYLTSTTASKWKLFPLCLDLVNGPITSMAFSKHNNKIAATCQTKRNNEIYVWDYTTGILQIGPLKGHHYSVNRMLFSREDSVLTSFSRDSLKSWRFFNKSSEKVYQINADNLYDVSLDGYKILGKDSEKNEILIYNSTDFSAEFNKLEPSGMKDPKFLIFSYDAIYCLGGDKVTLTIWLLRTGKIKHKIKDLVKSFVCCIFSKKSDKIATGSFSGLISLWNVEKGSEICTFKEKHKGEVILLAFSHNDCYLASADSKNKIFVWNIASQSKIFEMVEHEKKIVSIEISHNNAAICSISEDKNIKLWNFVNFDNSMRDLEKTITSYKKISCLKFSWDWNMYCVIYENRKHIDFFEIKEKKPVKTLEFANVIIKIFWSKNNDIFLVFATEIKCYMYFLNREMLFLEKGLKINNFYKNPEKFTTAEIQRIVDGEDGKVIPFGYTFLQIVAYTNDYKSFFHKKLLKILSKREIKIKSSAFFEKDIHGNSCIDIVMKKKEKIILKIMFKYIIKQYNVRDLYADDYHINMTLLYKLLKIFGDDTYIIDKLLKISFESPEKFPVDFNHKELPEVLLFTRKEPQLTKTELKPILSNHIKEYVAKGSRMSKFKTKMNVKCVYISDILDSNNPDTLLFFKNICKLKSTNKLFENQVLANVISYIWETEGSEDFFKDAKINLIFLILYLINTMIIFPYRKYNSSYFDYFCYISIFCDVIYLVFVIYQCFQESYQCYKLSFKHYISSIWNVADVLRIFSGIISVLMDITACFDTSFYKYAKACHSSTIFLLFIKIISFARGLENSAFIVRLIIQVFLDIRWFLLIVFSVIFGLGCSVFILQTKFSFNPLESFNVFFRITLGDFTEFDDLSVMSKPLLYVYFLGGSILVTIILLNLLIAIICDTYKKVSRIENFTRIYEMCSILFETDIREPVKDEKEENKRYLFHISNVLDIKNKENKKIYQRIKQKLKKNNQAFIDKINELEQKFDHNPLKDRKSSIASVSD